MLEEHKVHYDGDVSYCEVTTHEGRIGFKAAHEDFICTLEPHTLITYHLRNGSEKSIRCAYGVLMFRDNSCTVTFSKDVDRE